MYILHLPSWFPEAQKPYTGNFIEKHIEAIAAQVSSITLRVVKTDDLKQRFTDQLVSPDNRVITFYVLQKKGFLNKVYHKLFILFLYQKGIRYMEEKYGIPALIHLHVSLPLGNLALRLKKRWTIPLLLTEHWSVYHPENWGALPLKRQREVLHILKNVDALTSVSTHLLQAIKKIYPIKNGFVVSNVVKTDLFKPVEHQNQTIRILHVSTLDPKAKNVTGILEVITKLKEIRADFVLDVISEFESQEAIQYVRDYQLEKWVRLLGSMSEDQVAREMGKSDFFLLFSNYENQPCVILESFSCGIPVIATSVGGIPDIVNTERGILVEKKDQQALLQAILQMFDTYSTYDKINIRDYAVNNFSPSQIGKAFHHIYKMLLEH